MSTCRPCPILSSFQWFQELKEKKKAQALAALGVRKSAISQPVKVFYGESTASEEEKKTGSLEEKMKRGFPKKPKLGSPKKPKLGSLPKKCKVLCHFN